MLGGALGVIVGLGKTLGRAVSVGPSLLLQRRKAAAIFAQRLLAQGLDPEAVAQLTTAYKGLGSMQDWLSPTEE